MAGQFGAERQMPSPHAYEDKGGGAVGRGMRQRTRVPRICNNGVQGTRAAQFRHARWGMGVSAIRIEYTR